VFIEDIEDENYYPEWTNEYIKYHIVFEWDIVFLIDKKCRIKNQILIDELNLKPLKSIAPNYMMDPSVTIK
jgi:hypothetical protein